MLFGGDMGNNSSQEPELWITPEEKELGKKAVEEREYKESVMPSKEEIAYAKAPKWKKKLTTIAYQVPLVAKKVGKEATKVGKEAARLGTAASTVVFESSKQKPTIASRQAKAPMQRVRQKVEYVKAKKVKYKKKKAGKKGKRKKGKRDSFDVLLGSKDESFDITIGGKDDELIY